MGQSCSKDHAQDKAAWDPEWYFPWSFISGHQGGETLKLLAGKKNICLKCRGEEHSPCQRQINSAAGMDCALCCIFTRWINMKTWPKSWYLAASWLDLIINQSVHLQRSLWWSSGFKNKIQISLNYVFKLNRQNTFFTTFFQSTTMGFQHYITFPLSGIWYSKLQSTFKQYCV